MNNIQLEYFISVANHLSFTKAAEDCHVVQATISRQIAKLEAELGVPLFERGSHHVQLTPAGKIMEGYAPVFLEYHRNMMAHVQNAPKGFDHTLRIGVGPMEYNLLSQPLKLFHKLFPYTGIDLNTYTYYVLLTRYRNNVLDICICNEESAKQMPNFSTIELYNQPWYVAASSESSFWSLSRDQQSSLSGFPVITQVSNEFESVRSYCLTNNLLHGGFFETNFLSTQLELLQSGLGIAILPPFIKNSLPPGIRMENVLPIPFAPKFTLAYNSKQLQPDTQLFIDLCLQSVNKLNT